MARAVIGNPDLDRDVVQRFVHARDTLAAAVAEVLGNESVARNLGQDSFDDIETSLRETRIETDRGLLVFARWRTIRSRQAVGGAIASISRRVADLEEAMTTPDPATKAEVADLEAVITAPDFGPKAESTESQERPAPDPVDGEAGVQLVEELVGAETVEEKVTE